MSICIYTGENVVIMSPDSEILSVLQAATSSEVRLTVCYILYIHFKVNYILHKSKCCAIFIIYMYITQIIHLLTRPYTIPMCIQNPDETLKTHFIYSYTNGEARLLQPLIKPRDTLPTGIVIVVCYTQYRCSL